jgi:hypothetical protein
MQVMLEAGENFLKVEQVEGADRKPDLLITMDRTKVNTRVPFRFTVHWNAVLRSRSWEPEDL